MKKYFISSLLLCGFIAAFLTACNNGSQSTATEAGPPDSNHATGHDMQSSATENSALMQSMNRMMDEMHHMKMSGNPDRNFAEMMIVHHQGAVDMAKAELESGKDTAMWNMATVIAAAQEEEIANMRRIAAVLPELKTGTNTDTAGTALMASMNGMMQASGHTKMTGDVDKDFVTMMIPHHKGAVEMAKVQLKQGRNAELKQMAQQMIDDQTREISQFKQWLAAHP